MVRLVACCETQLYKNCLEIQIVRKPNRNIAFCSMEVAAMAGKVESEISNSAYSRCIIPAYWPLGTAFMNSVFCRLCQLWSPDGGQGGWEQIVTLVRAQPTNGTEGKASLSRQADKVVDNGSKGCKVHTEEPPGSCNSPGRSNSQDCLFQGIYEEPARTWTSPQLTPELPVHWAGAATAASPQMSTAAQQTRSSQHPWTQCQNKDGNWSPEFETIILFFLPIVTG